MRGVSSYPNYFCIGHIMATREKMPCKTSIALPKLGFLKPDNKEKDLAGGMILNVPVWLVQMLFKNRMDIFRPKVPHPLQKETRDVFEADATVVNLFKLSPNFFELGLCFLHLKHRESELVRELLIKVLRSRFKMIFEWSVYGMMESEKIELLDFTEQRLLTAGQKPSEEFNKWLCDAQFRISQGEMVLSFKRKKPLCELTV